jgi:hypothetical protein
MLYLILLIVAILAAGGALAALVIALVMAFKREWRRFMLFALTLLACLAVGGFSIASMIVKAGFDATSFVKREIAAAEAREKVRIDAVKALTPSEDFSKIDEQFFQYPGIFDWYRVPLRWPYEMHSIDTLERGFLYRNTAGGKSDNPNVQCVGIPGVLDITHYACDANLLLFRRETHAKTDWGMLTFDGEKTEFFDTEADMFSAAQARGWTGPSTLSNVKDNFDHYWVH